MMRTNRLAAFAILALLIPSAGSHAAGVRTVDQTDLIRALNGNPVYLGEISATTSATSRDRSS